MALNRLRESGPVYFPERRGAFSELFSSSKQDEANDTEETRALVAAWVDFLYLHGLNMVFFAYDEFGLDDQARHNVLNTHRLGLEFTAIHPDEPDKDYPDGGVNPARKFKVSRLKVVPLDQAKDLGTAGVVALTEHAFEAEVAAGRALADAHFRSARHADEPARYLGCVAVQATLHAGPPFARRMSRDRLLYLDVSGAFAAAARRAPVEEAPRLLGEGAQRGWMMDREDRQSCGLVVRAAEKQTEDPWEIYRLDEDGLNALVGMPSEKMQFVLGLLTIAIGLVSVAVVGYTVWYVGRAIWRIIGRWRVHLKVD